MKKKCIAKVRYMNEMKSIEVSPEVSILQNLVKAKLPIGRSCNGEGICTTCRIFIIKGEVSKPGALEEERRRERGFKTNERLSCQCRQESEELFIEIP